MLVCTVLITITFGVSELWSLVMVIMLLEHFEAYRCCYRASNVLLANVSAFFAAAWIMAHVPIAVWEPAFRSNTVLFV